MSTAAIKLANKVQGHDSNATPPAWLLTAVERHLIEFPRDDEWLLECTPGTFGVVTCMESDCYNDIELEADFGMLDGGRKNGFGSLNRFHDHIRSSHAHATARDARHNVIAKVEIDRKPNIGKDRKPDISQLATSIKSSTTQTQKASGSGAKDAPDRKPSRAILDSLDKYSSSPVPKADKGKGIKRTSSGPALPEDAPLPKDGRDKKPKLDVKPNIFSDAANKPVGPPSPPMDFATEEERLEAEIAAAKQRLQMTLQSDPHFRHPGTFSTIDECNRIIGRQECALAELRSQRLAWIRQHGPLPVPDRATQLKNKLQTVTNTLNSLNAKLQDIYRRARQPGTTQAASQAFLQEANRYQNDVNRYTLEWSGLTQQMRLYAVKEQLAANAAQAAQVPRAGPSGYNQVRPEPVYMAPQAGSSSTVGSSPEPSSGAQAAMELGRAALGGLFSGGLADEDNLYRGLDTFHGNQEEMHALLRQAAEGSDFEGNATVDEAFKKLKLKKQKECVPGMRVSLMPHQLIGVAWMVDQETTGKNYGGILADEMGLGKTVQTIATMCANPSKNPKEKSNLIVAPLALLEQWKEEIEEKCEPNMFNILIYHGEVRKKVKKVEQLEKYDIVLTTYHTLSLDFPDEEAAMKRAEKEAREARKNGDADAKPEDFYEPNKAGILMKMNWYRMIIDEAQYIRNKGSRISRAVTEVEALFRWCLTGTPVTNSLGDLFPLFRFLQIKPLFDFKSFHQIILQYEKKQPVIAGNKAQHVLRTCMLRRRKDTKLDGKELVTLPAKHTNLLSLEFSQEEREIYDFVEHRAQAKFNKYLKQGTVLKNYAHVLVMLLRLRQVCFHPCLISDGYDEFNLESKQNKSTINELQRARDVLGKDAVARLRAERMEIALARSRAEKEQGDEANDSDECPICMEDVASGEGGGIVTKCAHVFCHSCIQEVLAKPMPDDNAENKRYKDNERPCPSCRGPISKTFIFALDAFEPTDEAVAKEVDADGAAEEMDVDLADDSEDDENELRLDRIKRKTDKTDGLDGFIVNDDEEDELDSEDDKPVLKVKAQANRAVIQDSEDEEDSKPSAKAQDKGKGPEASSSSSRKEKRKALPEWQSQQEPSTKMTWVLNEVMRVHEEFPDQKIIIISSFTSALDIMDDLLAKHDFLSVRYQGDMNRNSRDQSVRVLKKSKKCKILLMSLTAGGVGLNLTRANCVISMDLAWSAAVENQAFSRSHRIGQEREVTICELSARLTIQNTVEQRLSEIQDRKQALADHSMGEGNGQRVRKLTIGELARLFGLNARGERVE